MRAISERPEPMRPATPTTSPGCTRNEIPSHHAGLAEARHGQDGRTRTRGRLAGRVDLVDRAADHERDQPIDGHLGPWPAADDVPVAQDGDPVAQPHHVAQDVADVDDRDATGAKPPDLGEQALALA